MDIDFELYRRDVRISIQPRLRLSVIDISPEFPRQTLVFIHGFGGQAAQWQHQIEQFWPDHRVVAIDLRGHGQSDKPQSAYTMAEILGDLEIALITLGINQPIFLLGHSFGGAVAASFARKHPLRVKGLVLVAAAVRFELSPLYRTALRMPLALVRAADPLVRKQLWAPAPVLKAWYENNLAGWNGEEVYSQVRTPTLVIRGYFDDLFAKPAFEQVAQLIPQAEEIDVGASGHMVMLERKEAVNRAVARFIEAEDPTWTMSELASEDQRRAELMKERPWLGHYEQGVPTTIAIPRTPLFSLLQSAARRFPKHTALIFKGGELSYQALLLEVNRFANLLRSLGITKGERVVLILPNLPQMVIAFYGTLLIGAVAVFAQPGMKPEDLVQVIRASGARLLVTLTQFDELIQQIRRQASQAGEAGLEHVIFTHIADYLPLAGKLQLQLSPSKRQQHLLDIPLDAAIHRYVELLRAQSADAPEVDVGPGDLAVISYTGWSDGHLRGVMLTHRNLVANTLQTRHWMPDVTEGAERVLSVVPLAHLYGLAAGLNVPIAVGASIMLEAEFELDELLEDILRFQPTIFPGVPKIFLAIMNAPGVRRYGLASIRINISGADPMPLELLESYQKLTQSRLTEGYGLSEASPITHVNPLGGLQKPGTIGLPLPSTEARLVDLRLGKRRAPPGQIGELAIRGPQVMAGYWGDERATRRVLTQDGWLLTGDVAQVDSDGYFRIIARKEDMWYPGRSERPASPRAIEEVLQEIPQVKEVAVTAIAGQPVAFVVPHQDRPKADALIAYCKRRLPPELTPRLVIFVEEFPRSFAGKILRQELARLLQEKGPAFEQGGELPVKAET